MPDYSILDYYVNGTTIVSNELKGVTGANTIEVIIHRLLSQRILIYVHISAIPVIYYKSYRLDMEEDEMQWSIIGKENWKTLPLVSGFETYPSDGYDQTPRCRKENGRVYLSGALRSNTILVSTTGAHHIATLPEGYRPKYNKIFNTYLTIGVPNSTIDTSCRLDILLDGRIRIGKANNSNTGTIFFLSLDSINFEID